MGVCVGSEARGGYTGTVTWGEVTAVVVLLGTFGKKSVHRGAKIVIDFQANGQCRLECARGFVCDLPAQGIETAQESGIRIKIEQRILKVAKGHLDDNRVPRLQAVKVGLPKRGGTPRCKTQVNSLKDSGFAGIARL